MKIYHHILCPIDYSNYSIEAVQHALAISSYFKARLTLLHVFNLPGFVAATGFNDEVLAKARQDLNDFAALHASTHLDLETNVVMGSVGDNIIETALSINTDLIVMGSHGYSAVKKFLLGSVAEQIMNHSKIPVMIIRL